MRLSPSDAIVHEFLEPATRILSERAMRDGETAGKVFFEFAQFCTSQLEDQHGIEDAKRMEGLHKAKQDEAQAYSKLIKTAENRNDKNEVKRLTKDYERALKLQKMDKTEWQRLVNLQQILLKKAVENYLRCFSACAEFDHYVPKFCALWLKHSKQKVVNSVVADGLGLVPSYKFLSLMHQLCSRLSTEGGEFQDNLGTLLSRLLHDHPYHSLHQIFNTISSGGDSIAISRANAAQSLTTRMDHRRKIGEVPVNEISVRLYQQFMAYSELANTPVDKKQGAKEIQMSMYPSLRKFRSNTLADLHLPPPSLKLPVSHDRRYADILYIQKYHHSFRIAGGVNQPKILDSVVSNGNSFRELVRSSFLRS
jgi:ataxia telangiectasia mutated family protein